MEVQILENKGFVWNVQDIKILREKHRILGHFVGFCPKTFDESLPLMLLPEEVQLLKEKDLIKLYQINAETQLSQEVVNKGLDFKEQNYQLQVEEFKTERIERIKQMADKIVEGKRKKLQSENQRKKLKANNAASVVTIDDDDKTEEIDANEIIDKEIANIKPISRDMQVIQTFEQDPWLQHQNKSDSSWTYPITTTNSKCRLYTFKDLWNHNYFVTEGSKFGGDFLVYCGDPVKYHAKYIVICIESEEDINKPGRVQDIIARCRLGTSVKKIVLFSWLSGDDVKYKSLTRGNV